MVATLYFSVLNRKSGGLEINNNFIKIAEDLNKSKFSVIFLPYFHNIKYRILEWKKE